MSKDVKAVQRGMDVQTNDLVVEPGTPTHAVNVDYQRDGVASVRSGYDAFYDGLPWYALAANVGNDGANGVYGLGSTRGFFELFSKDRLFHHGNGFIWAYDDVNAASAYWRSVPVNLPHRMRLHSTGPGFVQSAGIGLAVTFGKEDPTNIGSNSAAFRWQENSSLIGSVASDSTVARAGSGLTLNGALISAFDVISAPNGLFTSDNSTIRTSAFLTILAGSLTASGSANGTGAAATFNGASWMTTDGTNLYVADNTNMIRKVVISSGVVTTLAGSVTAGDSDGVGTAARFRAISGMCYSAGFVYVTESAGNRVRKIDVTTASVTIFAGSLTVLSGYTDAVGTAARFNTPIGIEVIGDSLYLGDTSNNRIRRIIISSASVTTLAGRSNTSGAYGMVGGPWSDAYLPSVTVRCVYVSYPTANLSTAAYLGIECGAPNSSIDVGLCYVSAGSATSPSSTGVAARDQIYHIARCPSGLPNITNGPNKWDSVGPNAYSIADTRGIDIGGGGAVFSTSEYPRTIDLYTRVNSYDAMPRLRSVGIDWPEAPSCTTTSGSTFANNTTWAYRTVCGLNLPNGRIALGPPSDRIVVTNTSGGTVSGSVTAFPAPGLPYDGLPFVQVYRTQTFSSSLDPGDQMFLCYEAALTYGQGVSFTDSLPDALLGAELYTNDTEQGLASSSLAPPLFATEIAEYNGRLVLGNYIDRPSVRIKLLGVSSLVTGTSNLIISTTGVNPLFTTQIYPCNIASLTAATVTSISSLQFGVTTSGSAASNAVATAREIVRVINRSFAAEMFRARYDEDDPGSFVVYAMGGCTSRTGNVLVNIGSATVYGNSPVQASITVSTNASSAFQQISNTPSLRRLNAIAWSDQGDIDSFPAINARTVGPSVEAIQRLLPIDEVLLAVKDDYVFRLGTTFDSEIYSTSLSCLLPDSFARLDDKWIGLFTRGFRALTAVSASPIGRMIDRDVVGRYNSGDVMIASLTNFASGAGNDLPGSYICRFNGQIYQYNAQSESWSLFDMPILASTTAPTWFGSFRNSFVTNIAGSPRAVLKARDMRFGTSASLTNQWYRDYAEIGYEFGSASVATDGVTITATVPTSLLVAGAYPLAAYMTGAVYSKNGTESLVVAYAGTTSATITVATPIATLGTVTSLGSITLYAPVRMRMEYAPTIAPGSENTFGDVVVTLERVRAGSLTANFYGRVDLGSATGQFIPTGEFISGQGKTRTNFMPSLTASETQIAYYDVQRFATPSERARDQQVVVELIAQAAFQPLAIKSTVVEILAPEGSKIKR